MGNDIRENKHFARANKKRAFRRDRFSRGHKRENNLLREFENLIYAAEAGELSESILSATSGRTADYVCEVFHQEKLRNGSTEELSM
ncbi:MAG: hypothetical protein IKT33_00315 [Clostridia bacterium]|nr:hypothetical protein [Clostridia bacterium]